MNVIEIEEPADPLAPDEEVADAWSEQVVTAIEHWFGTQPEGVLDAFLSEIDALLREAYAEGVQHTEEAARDG